MWWNICAFNCMYGLLISGSLSPAYYTHLYWQRWNICPERHLMLNPTICLLYSLVLCMVVGVQRQITLVGAHIPFTSIVSLATPIQLSMFSDCGGKWENWDKNNDKGWTSKRHTRRGGAETRTLVLWVWNSAKYCTTVPPHAAEYYCLTKQSKLFRGNEKTHGWMREMLR